MMDSGLSTPTMERASTLTYFPRLFDAFVTTGRQQGGTGLGMAISHNIIVNLLGGTISCESEPGSGATFIIDSTRICTRGNRGNYYLTRLGSATQPFPQLAYRVVDTQNWGDRPPDRPGWRRARDANPTPCPSRNRSS